MRTKFVLGAAILAAGLVSTMAQVYSLNIVGYTVSASKGYSYLSNPLDNGDNSANTIFPNPNPGGGNPGPWDGSDLQEWTGVGWKVNLFDSFTEDTTTGFTDGVGVPVPAPILGSAKGFLLNNQAGAAITNVTFVGQVRQGIGTPTSYTNVLPLVTTTVPYSLGSMLPISGGIGSALGFVNPNPGGGNPGPLDGCNLQFLKTDPITGAALGFDTVLFDSFTEDTTTGFTDGVGAPIAEPQIGIGQGFIFVNQGAGTFNWTQLLNP